MPTDSPDNPLNFTPEQAYLLDAIRKTYAHVEVLNKKIDQLIEAVKSTNTGPAQPEGEEIWITGLIFREHANDDGTTTLVVDCYPDWKGTKYGMFREAFFYLDTDQDIEQLINASGLMIEADEHGFNLMLRDEEAPLKRKPNVPYEYLYSLKDPAHPERRPFKVLKTDTGKVTDKGFTIYDYKIAR